MNNIAIFISKRNTPIWIFCTGSRLILRTLFSNCVNKRHLQKQRWGSAHNRMHSLHNLLHMVFYMFGSILANPSAFQKHLHHGVSLGASSLLEAFYRIGKQVKLLAKLNMLKSKVSSCRWHVVSCNRCQSVFAVCRRVCKYNLLFTSLLSGFFCIVVVSEPFNNSSKNSMRGKNLRNICWNSAQIFANHQSACASCLNAKHSKHSVHVVVHVSTVFSSLTLRNPP